MRPLPFCWIWAWVDKTVITLTAINDLMFDSFEVHKVLVIAPKRVAATSWPDEIEKWDHLRHLRFAVAVGSVDERIAALQSDASGRQRCGRKPIFT